MGYSDIDSASPAASDLVSAGDDEIRALKADVLAGAGVEHQIVGGGIQDGRHKFPIGASSPTVVNVDGHIAFQTGVADNPMLYVEGTGVARVVGIHRLEVASGAATVANNSGVEVTLATYSDAHKLYVVTAYVDTNCNVEYAQGVSGVSPAGLYVWIRRTRTGSSTGNDKLALRNEGVGSDVEVTYKVFELLGFI